MHVQEVVISYRGMHDSDRPLMYLGYPVVSVLLQISYVLPVYSVTPATLWGVHYVATIVKE
jgi:hypothetical protein